MLNFVSQAVNTDSAVQEVTFRNGGAVALNVKIATTGDFTQKNTCNTSVAAGSSCTISVTFTPSNLGARTGSLTVTGNFSGSPQTVSLSGVGAAAIVGAPAKPVASTASVAPDKSPNPAAGASRAKSFTFTMKVPAGTTNAVEIASLLNGSIPGVTSVTATSSNSLAFVLDSTKVVLAPAKHTQAQISTDDLVEKVTKLAVLGHVFTVSLTEGTNKACDVAQALVNVIPGILEISAVGDNKLLITSADSSDAESAAATAMGEKPKSLPELRKQYEELVGKTARAIAAPAIASSPHVDNFVQRLYYVHDPVAVAAVAAIVNNAMPNVNAQALAPDLVILSDSADTDEKTRQNAIHQARQMIAKIDQPRPQVSVNAWSMQLASDDQDGADKASRRIEDASTKIEQAAAEYDQAIDRSRQAGWKYLSTLLANPDNIDPLLREYLSYSTRITPNTAGAVQGGTVKRVADPSNKDSIQTTGYGLGYSTLYYPLTPNLIDMFVTFISLKDPASNTDPLLDAMEGDNGKSAHEAYQKSLDKYKMKIKEDPNAVNPSESCQQRDLDIYDSYRSGKKAKGSSTTPTDQSPERFQLECMRDVLSGVLLKPSSSPLSTGTLGQFRAALADFLFQYKIMVMYPDDFDPYYEPMAADTLDSAFNPLVNAFNQDLNMLQHDLQEHIGYILRAKDSKVKGYGYSGLVNLKVLGSQQGIVNTATQNYFDATPTASLNTLLSNLGTQAGSGASLTSLFTGISPDKAIAILTALGATLNPSKVTAHIGRELDLTVTAHTLSGAYGAELDVQVNSKENGQSVYTQGASTTSDDLNSRVAAHSVNTHVRLDSLRLLQLSTMSSVLARSQPPWRPFDPYIEIPGLNMIVKHPKNPKEVYTQSLVFLDAMVVPSAIDLGYGFPITSDKGGQPITSDRDEKYEALKRLNEADLSKFLMQYHQSIVNCLSREYIGIDNQVIVAGGQRCTFGTDKGKGEIDPDPLHYNAVDSGVPNHPN
jgi:hypothetical protein